MKRYTIKSDQHRPFLVDYKGSLNPEQYAVVAAGSGPLLVIAGAGSGKTRTVTYRVARLIESGIAPSEIMLLTFTNRAAREMLQRVEALIKSDVRKVWGGTFHSVANRILRRHADSLGYKDNYSILDGEDTKDLLETCIAQAGVNTIERRFPKGEVLRDIVSMANNTDTTVNGVIVKHYPQFEPLSQQIERLQGIYQQRKLERNAMDYDDLLRNWKRLLTEKPEIADLYSRQFKYILVDEYQDTNKLQAEIVDLLASHHSNVMVVGDDAQSIFSWRGAHLDNILTFRERYEKAQEFKLETNYRSTPEILLLANASIKNNQLQHPKHLRSARQSTGQMPALIPARDVDQQAAFVASRVLELRDEGVSLDEMAVLYRSHYHSMELQLELTRRGIPYVVRSGVRFFEQAHIKDITAYLRLVTNPDDELAWKRVLKLIPRIGNATATRVWDHLAVSAEPLALVKATDGAALSIPRSAQAGWSQFVRLLKRLTEPEVLDQPAKQIEIIMSSGYQQHLQTNFDNADSRIEDIRQLGIYAGRYQTTESFLSELALLNTERFGSSGAVVGEDVIEGSDEDEHLVLSSIHQAKGLEWKVVFLIWAAEGKFPSARSLRDPESEEEERRLFYVAITRSKDDLYIIYPLIVTDFQGYRRQTVIQKPSHFITELSTEMFEIWALEEDLPALEAGPEQKLIN